MSSTLDIHLGVLLKIREIYEEHDVYSHNECSFCQTKSDGKFCPNCGKETQMIYKKKKKYKNVYDYVGDDWIYKPSDYLEFYIPNECDSVLFNYCGHSNNDNYIFQNDFNVENYINEFKETYKENIDILEKEFGEIEISFGLVTYWS
jgi:CRISPR/Cas system-associated endonuclease/helicase Cas3